MTDLATVGDVATAEARSIAEAVSSVVLGKDAQVWVATAALLAGQHVLLADQPGVGKTTLAVALGRVLGGRTTRVQGTVDLLPTDLSGVTVYNQATATWAFRPGPIFANVVLIDEINRISPRTQSALLEAMAERQVSTDGSTYALPDPFLVIGTMNPAGSEGTFPLTCGQLDRFGVALSLGPADREHERALLLGVGGRAASSAMQSVVSPEQVVRLRAATSRVVVAEAIADYVLDICAALRSRASLSSRASLALIDLCRAWALLAGRSHLVPDDVKMMAVPVLAHRVAPEGQRPNETAVLDVLERVPAPRG